MNTIDKSGLSVEDIIREFRLEHNIRDHELKYEIIKRPSKGIFGLFANKLALVRFQVPESSDRVRLFTETLLKKMGISYSNITSKMEGKTLYLTIEGIVETGFIIGKNGSMLETIQYLVNRVFEGDRKLERIYLDADGYRERRESQFLHKYLPQINKIKVHGKALTLEPMSPGERRIIHRHIERDKGLRTLTIGDGENKRIVIFSSKQKESEVLQQTKQDGKPEARRNGKPQSQENEPADKPARTPRPRPRPEQKTEARPEMKRNTNRPNSEPDSADKPRKPRPRRPRPPRRDDGTPRSGD
ncbi:MAG: Jag N-terminal domain-containing protein [Candidatus Cloacimonetes bacterium]|jgi:spoIIIJ-associated protein|nr:Jag N-terminal domain-containing protein [Candidatus Cloacimonadota bacterium]MDD4100477.1 Jag N-terminal domain-containing protein [Candidatus Cloacimonadota bacterium]MDD4806231.1 Jag N-terminal domain-containing protein [Candidatus Cloacimonadota bacterium]